MPVPAGYAEVRIPASLNPAIYGVFTFGCFPVDADSDPTGFCEDVWDAFAATLLGRSDNETLWGPVEATIGTPAGDLPASGTSQAVGPRSDEMEAPNVAILVQKRTPLGGRRNRGRFYLPFMLSQDDLEENGIIGTVALTATQTECNDFLTALQTADIPMFLLHSDGGSPTVVTSLVVQQLAATQRRRLRR